MALKFDINKEGMRQLLTSDEVLEAMQAKADEIVAKASHDGYTYETTQWHGANRVNVSVITRDGRTYAHNLKTNELLKIVGGSK